MSACLAGGLTGLILYLNLVFEARHSWLLVIPTPGSLSRLWDLIGTGAHDANRYAPPAPNLPGLLLLAAGGVGIAAVLADLIAVRLRSTALAGLPLLVLFTVPVTMDASHDQFTTSVVFCLAGAGYLAMLSADGRERIRVWGRLVSLWRQAPRRGAKGSGPDTRTLAAAGRRVGLASIVLALCAPVIVPGLHPSKLFSSGPGIGGRGGSGGQFLALPGALSQTLTQLHEPQPRTVFTYTTSASASQQASDAEYFRQYAFDTLGGSGWLVDNYAAGAVPVSALPDPQGLTDATAAQTVTSQVRVSRDYPGPGAQPTFLPLPYPAIDVRAPGKWLADPDRMVYSTSDSIAGRTYSVTSAAVDPSQAQLAGVPGLVQAAALAPDLRLPGSYRTARLKRLATSNTAGQTTEFGKVNALATWLSGSQFTYTLATPPLSSAASLTSFLTKGKSGYCVQYAYAMTVLTRLLGIPARFVIGYTAGTRLEDGSYEVRNADAHAWTEVYFPSLGWLRFEPTPAGQGTASAPNYMTAGAGLGLPGNTDPARPATTAPGPVKSPPPDAGACWNLGPDVTGAATAAGGRRHAVDRGRAGRDRGPGDGHRADRDRGPAGPAGHGRPSGLRPPPAPHRDRRRGGRGRGRPGRPGPVPADVPRRGAESRRRLGHRGHRVRRDRRGGPDRPVRVPAGAAPLAVDARGRRLHPGPRRLARVPRRSCRLRRDEPPQRAAPHAGRPGHHHDGRTRGRGRHPAGPGRGAGQLRGPPGRVSEPAPGQHHRPPGPVGARPPRHPLARGRLPRLDNDHARRGGRADSRPSHGVPDPAPPPVTPVKNS